MVLSPEQVYPWQWRQSHSRAAPGYTVTVHGGTALRKCSAPGRAGLKGTRRCLFSFVVWFFCERSSKKPPPPAHIYVYIGYINIYDILFVCVRLVQIHTRSPHSVLLHLAPSTHSTPVLFFSPPRAFNSSTHSLFKSSSCLFMSVVLPPRFCVDTAGSTPESGGEEPEPEREECLTQRGRLVCLWNWFQLCSEIDSSHIFLLYYCQTNYSELADSNSSSCPGVQIRERGLSVLWVMLEKPIFHPSDSVFSFNKSTQVQIHLL